MIIIIIHSNSNPFSMKSCHNGATIFNVSMTNVIMPVVFFFDTHFLSLFVTFLLVLEFSLAKKSQCTEKITDSFWQRIDWWHIQDRQYFFSFIVHWYWVILNGFSCAFLFVCFKSTLKRKPFNNVNGKRCNKQTKWNSTMYTGKKGKHEY